MSKQSRQHLWVRRRLARDSHQFAADTYPQFIHHAFRNLYAWEFLSVTDYDHQGFEPRIDSTAEAERLREWCDGAEFAQWMLAEPGLPDWLQKKLLMRLLQE